MKIQIVCLGLLLLSAGMLYSAEQPEPVDYNALAMQSDDVLENMAQNFSDKELGNFALVSRRFHNIAQTVLHQRPTWQWHHRTRHLFAAHAGPIHSLYFLSDGNIVSIGAQDGIIKVSDSKNGREIREIVEHNESPVCLTAFSPASNVLATAYEDTNNTISVWDVKNRDRDKINQFFVFDKVRCLALSPDGQTLAGAWDDGQSSVITLWDVKDGSSRQITPGYFLVKSLVFSPDGKRLVSGAYRDEAIREWDIKTLKVKKEYEYGHADELSFLPDGRLIDRSRGPFFELKDVATGKPIAPKVGAPHYGFIKESRQATLSHDGKLFAAGYINKTVIWNVKTGKVITELDHKKDVTSIAFSLDDRMLAAGCTDGSIIMWKVGQ